MTTSKQKLTRISAILLSMVLLFGILSCAPFTVSAAVTESEEVSSDDFFEYEVDSNGYAWITGTNGYRSDVVIPSKIDGYTVGAINDNAFEDDRHMESVKIPNTVEYIGMDAFNSCRYLHSISISDSVILIGAGAFENTSYFNNSNNWTNGVLYVGNYAIRSKDHVTKISLKKGTIGIADNMAAFCTDLTAFTIPESVKYIGLFVAIGCPKMKSITIPNNVDLIGHYSFGFAINSDGSDFVKLNNFKVKGIKGSCAEDYAEYFGFTFVDGSAATSVKLNRSTLTLGVGEAYTLIKTVTPTVAGGACKWSSSNSTVASVNSKGTVTAKKAGTATITVKTANGLSKTCKVTVKPAPSSIKVSTSSLTLGKGEEFIISESTNAGSYAWKFNWSSSNTSVATVTKTTGNKAKIVAKGTGTANITVKTYNGKTATCKVTVKPAPSSVKLSTTSLTLGKGETFIISQNSNSGSYAKSFSWSSSNSSVATVKKTSGNKAKITAKNNGTATITFKTYNGKTATCKVTVKNAPTSVKTNPASVTLGVGETYTVSESTNSGSYANADNLKWSSTNTSVATVKKGSGNKAQIVAKGVGTAYVKITLYNGKTAQCKVTVKSAPSSVKMSKSEVMLQSGEEIIISESTNSGTYANAANLKWESSDTSVVTVTKLNGNKAKITAVGDGTATVILKLYNGKTAQCIVSVGKIEQATESVDATAAVEQLVTEPQTIF